MNIVFIINGYYPSYSTNGICINKIIQYINKEYFIHVISIKASEDEKELSVRNNESIHKVITKEYELRNKYNQKLRSENIRFKFRYKLKLTFVKMRRYLESIVYSENINRSLTAAYFNKLNDIGHIDMIIPACFPIEALESARMYHVENPTCVIVPLLFDKFTTSISHNKNKLNQMLKFRKHLQREKLILSQSEKIIATYDWEDYMNKYHSEYKKNVSFIEIPALFEFDNDMIDENKYDFLYAGVLDKKIRPPYKAIKIIEEVINQNEKINFHFITKGNCTQAINKFCRRFPLNVIHHGTLSSEQSYEKMKMAKTLLSIGNVDITQTPSKIFEYMSLDKPIIHFYDDENDRVNIILSKYQKSLCIDLNGDKKKEAKKVIDFLGKDFTNVHIRFNQLLEVFPEANPLYTADIFNRLIEEIDKQNHYQGKI